MSFHFRWTHSPFGISQTLPIKQIDILSNISKRIPQSYPFKFISEQMIFVIEYIWFSKMESVKRQVMYYFPLLKPVMQSLIHQIEIGENM